jgi:hypothetical protein|tara:strand:- start:10130 stop:10696 length:567 start_codon:yes stop_codon:yes gene_type:complete
MVNHDTLLLTADMDDAAVTQEVRRALRYFEVLTIDGDLSADIVVAPDWIAMLAEATTLPVVAAAGPVGLRGLALLLLADFAVVGPDVTWAGGDTSPLATLALLRLGPVGARGFALAEDPVSHLIALGHVTTSDDPAQAVQTAITALAPGAAHRLRQGWRAGRDLPANEALAFAAWHFQPPAKEESDAP